uniref:Uncharacterized protein n=1 Tax=Knipowitschia caucasica TaxID=637954 RepID=A0AAV2K853_KNICA
MQRPLHRSHLKVSERDWVPLTVNTKLRENPGDNQGIKATGPRGGREPAGARHVVLVVVHLNHAPLEDADEMRGAPSGRFSADRSLLDPVPARPPLTL